MNVLHARPLLLACNARFSVGTFLIIIINECAMDHDDIIIMGYSVCVALCKLYLYKHNWWKIHI